MNKKLFGAILAAGSAFTLASCNDDAAGLDTYSGVELNTSDYIPNALKDTSNASIEAQTTGLAIETYSTGTVETFNKTDLERKHTDSYEKLVGGAEEVQAFYDTVKTIYEAVVTYLEPTGEDVTITETGKVSIASLTETDNGHKVMIRTTYQDNREEDVTITFINEGNDITLNVDYKETSTDGRENFMRLQFNDDYVRFAGKMDQEIDGSNYTGILVREYTKGEGEDRKMTEYADLSMSGTMNMDIEYDLTAIGNDEIAVANMKANVVNPEFTNGVIFNFDEVYKGTDTGAQLQFVFQEIITEDTSVRMGSFPLESVTGWESIDGTDYDSDSQVFGSYEINLTDGTSSSSVLSVDNSYYVQLTQMESFSQADGKQYDILGLRQGVLGDITDAIYDISNISASLSQAISADMIKYSITSGTTFHMDSATFNGEDLQSMTVEKALEYLGLE